MSPGLASTDIAVHLYCGAYVTSTVRGQRASATSSDSAAAEGLGRKLYGHGFRYAERLSTAGHLLNIWRLHGTAEVPLVA